MHDLFVASALSISFSYVVLGVLAWQRGRGSDAHVVPRHAAFSFQTIVLVLVAMCHTFFLYNTLWSEYGSMALGYAQALSVVSCVGIWLFIVESFYLDIDGLRPLAIGLPAMAVVLGAAAPPVTLLPMGAWGVAHVLIGIAAHGVALLAAGHAMLLLALHQVLKTQSASSWAKSLTRHCPALVVLEKLLLRLSFWVVALLVLTIALGVLNGHLKWDHKTVLTLASLAVWLLVPWGYHRLTWRGAKLCSAVLCATGLLLLAYIGSRFVLQAILHR